MEETIVLLMQTGVSVLGNVPSDYQIDVFNGAELKPSTDGSFVRLEGTGHRNYVDLPLQAIEYLLATDPEIFIYSSETQEGVATYLGSIVLNRDLLIEANTWCKAYKQLLGEKTPEESADTL